VAGSQDDLMALEDFKIAITPEETQSSIESEKSWGTKLKAPIKSKQARQEKKLFFKQSVSDKESQSSLEDLSAQLVRKNN
jgi:hypothetical protein